MNRWFLSSLCAFSFGLWMGQKFFASQSHGQRVPNAVGSYLELNRSQRLKQLNQKPPKTLSEQIQMGSEEKVLEVQASEIIHSEAEPPNLAEPLKAQAKNSGFLDKIKDLECCNNQKPNDLQLSKIDLALEQTCVEGEKSCLEMLWNEITSIQDIELMRTSVERYMLRYSSFEPQLVLTQATELSKNDINHLEANAFAQSLGTYYERAGAEALEFFFAQQAAYGVKASEYAKIFLVNEMNQGPENQSQLLADLGPYAMAHELAGKMRKKVFSDWYDRDPEAAAQFAEGQGQDSALLEILNIKKQISSLKQRLASRMPSSVSSLIDPARMEVQAQIELLEKNLLEATRL